MVTDDKKTSLKVTRAILSDAGEYQAVLENKFGKITFSVKVLVLDKPGPPQNLKVTGVTEKTVSLKWSEPESDGGSDITGYIVEERETARSTWSKVTYLPITQLNHNTPDMVKVRGIWSHEFSTLADWSPRSIVS